MLLSKWWEKRGSGHAKSRDVEDIFKTRKVLGSYKSWIIDQKRVADQVALHVVDSQSDVLSVLRGVTLVVEVKKYAQSKFSKVLKAAFKLVIEIDEKTDLSLKEIFNITKTEHPENYIIGGQVDSEARVVTLFRGDFSPLIVSFDRFKANPESAPNFDKFRVIDGGMGIQFGTYEASVFPLLYEFDAVYRRSINKQRKNEDKTFGACLFRARRILGVNQSEFPNVRRETILRIENERSQKVRASTKEHILKRLGLTEEELLNY